MSDPIDQSSATGEQSPVSSLASASADARPYDAKTTGAREKAREKDKEPWLSVSASRHFSGWLVEQKISLAFTTYQAGKLLLLGVNPDGRLAVFERNFNRCMGLWSNSRESRTLWLSSLYQLWRLEDAPGQNGAYEGYDRVYIPRRGFTTADLDIHDIAVEQTGRLIFVNTLCSCIATISPARSFTPLWKPPMISKIAPEDRCHLNGLALENGRAAYVTACSISDVSDGWRDHRRDGGVVMDVRKNEVIAGGLSMPHSPRVHNGRLYLHNSGSGEFGWLDLQAGKLEPICFCSGYLRGLAFSRNYAIVGLSKPRDKTFTGLFLDEQLAKRNATPQCGLQVIDLRSGDVAHWVKLEGQVSELYDVVTLPGVVKPMALGFKTDEIQRAISMDPMGNL
jgi:uncharacterized protein (TIGR03032 family)